MACFFLDQKRLEVYFTTLIELFWNKERIMEVYLNSIEMGNGIYGAEAVAREHFHKNASKLTPEECALIAASLPNPRKFNSSRPGNYMLQKDKRRFLYLMKCVPIFPPNKIHLLRFQRRKRNNPHPRVGFLILEYSKRVCESRITFFMTDEA